MDQKKTGRLIARLRKEKNMTQLNLAERLGVTDRAISKWENGRGLPDLSLIMPLCEILGISINELLKGELIEKSQETSAAEQNIMVILSDREDEIKKRKRLKGLCTILAIITFIVIAIIGTKINLMLFAELKGDGYSFTAAEGTRKAEKAAELIVKGYYEKAVKNIGFCDLERESAEKEWCEAMEKLSEEIRIEYLMTSQFKSDDFYVSGRCMLIVYDKISDTKYVFDLFAGVQDNGIAFGSIYLGDKNTDSRKAEITEKIEEALSTWNPG